MASIQEIHSKGVYVSPAIGYHDVGTDPQWFLPPLVGAQPRFLCPSLKIPHCQGIPVFLYKKRRILTKDSLINL